jgi:hypothetical protein
LEQLDAFFTFHEAIKREVGTPRYRTLFAIRCKQGFKYDDLKPRSKDNYFHITLDRQTVENFEFFGGVEIWWGVPEENFETIPQTIYDPNQDIDGSSVPQLPGYFSARDAVPGMSCVFLPKKTTLLDIAYLLVLMRHKQNEEFAVRFIMSRVFMEYNQQNYMYAVVKRETTTKRGENIRITDSLTRKTRVFSASDTLGYMALYAVQNSGQMSSLYKKRPGSSINYFSVRFILDAFEVNDEDAVPFLKKILYRTISTLVAEGDYVLYAPHVNATHLIDWINQLSGGRALYIKHQIGVETKKPNPSYLPHQWYDSTSVVQGHDLPIKQGTRRPKQDQRKRTRRT